MTIYYYDKDRFGNEHCYEVDSIDEDCKIRLDASENNASCAVYWVWENNICGYSSLDEYIKGECEEAPTAEFEAIDEYLGNGGQYPFCIVRHPDDTYEAMPESEVDWRELADEYDDPGRWITPPSYYQEGEITPEQARENKMWALARALEGGVYVIVDKDTEEEQPDEYDTEAEALADIPVLEEYDRKHNDYKPDRYKVVKKED